MTNNIVAQFACSVWKPEEASRAASLGFSVGDFKEYRVVSDSVFNDEYNETLDSGTIVLSQIDKRDRLFNIKAYQYVRVFDKSGNTDFDKLFLVDTFDEKENNIKEHIFGYTINLMSETKWLEKFQCPNLTITHDINDGSLAKKTIYEHIRRYMELFIPKIKFCKGGNRWSYEPLIKMPGVDEEVLEGSLIVYYYDRNFTRVDGHGSVYYQFECESEQLPESVDYNSVELIGDPVPNDDDTDWIDLVAGFDPATGKFLVSGDSENMYYGSLTLHYRYTRSLSVNPFYQRFNVPCADLSFGAPTMRQLLTTLMQQVGCIPMVKNRTLTYLDLQKEAIPFAVDEDYSLGNTVNFIRRSLSSDSFVNTLVNMSDNVLDSENEVICETLGFRDRNNVLLKQRENLCLETSLPIYKVNKCILHGPVKVNDGYLSSSFGCFYVNPEQFKGTYDLGYRDSLDIVHPYEWPVIFYKETSVHNGVVNIKFRVSPSLSPFDFTVKCDKIGYWKRDAESGRYIISHWEEFEDVRLHFADMQTSSTNYFDLSENVSRTFTSKSKDVRILGVGYEVVGFFLSGVFVNNYTNEKKPFTFVRFADDDENVECHDCYGAREPMGPAAARTWVNQQYLGQNSENNPCFLSENSVFIARYSFGDLCSFEAWDMTKLVVEDSARQLLDRDFTKMTQEISSPETATIDNLSKYVYGTVGYSIGSKTISGFSDTFEIGNQTLLGWVNLGYSYIENIVNVLEKSGSVSQLMLSSDNYFEGLNKALQKKSSIFNYLITYGNITHNDDVGAFCCVNTRRDNPNLVPIYDESLVNGNIVGYSVEYYNAGNQAFDNKPRYFTGFYVDLYYQPLNSFNLAYVKSEEDIDIPLEQYDGNASGVTDFDRLSIHEQEQVDRIGNETLSISQRTTEFSKIRDFSEGPLVFKDDVNRDGSVTDADQSVNYIIFKRSYTIKNNCFNVSYIGSKDAVLKNYFTSIRTKYRAYQYVDYSQAVLRKERDTLFIRIAKDYYDGDDKVLFGESSDSVADKRALLTNFIYDLDNDFFDIGYERNISYEVENSTAKVPFGTSGYITERQTIKNSVSIVTNQKGFAFIYEYMDNVGAGPYIKDLSKNEDIGGVPQYWQIWDNSYNDYHDVKFTSYIDYYYSTTAYDIDFATEVSKIERSPIVDDSYPYTTMFSIVDNNKDSINDYKYGKRAFYKDASERINHTVQFIYYAPDKDVLVGENFASGVPAVNRFNNPYNKIVFSNNFELDENPHDLKSGEISINKGEDKIRMETLIGNKIPTLKVYSSYNGVVYNVIKMCSYNETTQKYIDIAVFKTNGIDTDYYFMINDTKSDYVLSEKNGILYRKYKAYTYTGSSENYLDRIVLDLYTQGD